MKVLFAVGRATLSESVAKKYLETYNEKLEYKDVFFFKAALEEVKRDKSYDRIIISETLERIGTNIVSEVDKMLFNNVDSITDEFDARNVIFICSDERTRGDSLLVRFYNIGVFNFLVGDERQIPYLCKLIREPRGKKQAKDYISGAEGEVGELLSDDQVDDAELLSIKKYFEKLSTDDEYRKAFDSLCEQYSSDVALSTICAALTLYTKDGEKIFSALNAMPKYQKYCAWRKNTASEATPAQKPKPKFNLNFFKGDKSKGSKSNELSKQVQTRREEAEESENDAKSKQEAALKAQQEAMLKAQQEAALKAQQEAAMKAQQEAALKAQQEAILKAQQEAANNASGGEISQEEMLKKQQEAMLKAQQDAMLKAQQEAMLKAQQEAALKAQQEAALKAQQEAMLQAQKQNQITEVDPFGKTYKTTSSPFEREEISTVSDDVDDLNDYSSSNVQVGSRIISVPNNYQKVVAFVGASKSGTSFIINSVANILANSGIKTSIIDTSKNKGLFWFYDKDTSSKIKQLSNCMTELSSGVSNPIQIGKNKNLSLYTAIPGSQADNMQAYIARTVVSTASSDCSILLLDCDFNTPYEYFELANEVYVVCDLDLIKCRETVDFLRGLQSKRYPWNKLKLIVNNTFKSKITPKVIKDDVLTIYYDAGSTFNEDIDAIKEYYSLPMEIENYEVYLEGIDKSRLKTDKYTSALKTALENIALSICGLSNSNDNKK